MLPGPPATGLRRLVGTYFVFTQERPKLWNLLNEHRMPAGREVPEWYQAKVENLLTPLEEALAPLLPGSDPVAQKRHARTLWASVHGMTSLSTADKLSHVTAHAGRSLVDDLDLDLSRRSAAALPGDRRRASSAPPPPSRVVLQLPAWRPLALPAAAGNEPVVGRAVGGCRRRRNLPVDRHPEPRVAAAAGAAAATPTSDAT